MFRAIQKLIRNGNSTQITIPRPVLMQLGWLPGEAIVLGVTERNTIELYPLRMTELAPKNMRRVEITPSSAAEPQPLDARAHAGDGDGALREVTRR